MLYYNLFTIVRCSLKKNPNFKKLSKFNITKTSQQFSFHNCNEQCLLSFFYFLNSTLDWHLNYLQLKKQRIRSLTKFVNATIDGTTKFHSKIKAFSTKKFEQNLFPLTLKLTAILECKIGNINLYWLKCIKYNIVSCQ